MAASHKPESCDYLQVHIVHLLQAGAGPVVFSLKARSSEYRVQIGKSLLDSERNSEPFFAWTPLITQIDAFRHPVHAEFIEMKGQYLCFIHACTNLNRRPPAKVEIQKYSRVTPPTMNQMIADLNRTRLIECIPGNPRRFGLLSTGQAP